MTKSPQTTLSYAASCAAPAGRPQGRRAALALLAAGALLPALSRAQAAWPTKPVRIVVPFTPGGSTDILARAIGTELSKAWGQPVVVENVPGVGGALGADRVAKAPPDGTTLLMGHVGTLAVNPSLYPQLPYDPLRDFAPVAWVARVPNVLVVHAGVAARNLRELVALAKSQPGRLNYGSGGNGSAAHLATEYLKLRAGISLVHIPYRGTAPALTDLIGGQIQLMFTGAPAVLGQLRSGQLRALAVSSPTRLEALPEVPTVREALGISDFEADQWYGVVAPAATPRELLTRLNAQINQSLLSTDMKTRLASEGAIAMPTTPEAFSEHIRLEITRWKRVIEAGRIKAD